MVPYPAELTAVPNFATWIRERVETQLMEGGLKSVPRTVADLSRPPKLLASSYRSMRAYGMHLRCKSAEISAGTADSGVAISFFSDGAGGGTRRNVTKKRLH